jgi:hypothetical protein
MLAHREQDGEEDDAYQPETYGPPDIEKAEHKQEEY